jgi:hypothetical protein
VSNPLIHQPQTDPGEPPQVWANWAWLALTVVLAGLYASTAANAVLGGDDGEFLTLMTEGGQAHPPGYQLTVLYLRLMSWLPGSPPHAAAWATSIVGVGAALMVGRASRSWGASNLGALMAAAVFGVSSMAWIQATHAEVFSLNALLAASICWLAGPKAPLTGGWNVAALAAVAGLGLANHHSLVLMFPIGLLAAMHSARNAQRPVLAVSTGALVFAAGIAVPTVTASLLPHPADAWFWGEAGGLGSWLHHVTRSDYGTFQLGAKAMETNALQHVARLMQHHVLNLLVAPFFAAIWAMGVHIRQADERMRHVALSLTYLTAGPLFVASFNLSVVGVSGRIVERFYLLPAVVLCVYAGLGWSALMRAAPLRRSFQAVVVCALLGAGTAIALPTVAAHHDPTVQHYLVATLESAPKDGVVLGVGDQRVFGLLYLQRVLRLRPDVTYIDPYMLHYPWYRQRIEKDLGRKLTGPKDQSLDTLQLANDVLATGRPLALATPFSAKILGALPNYPQGVLIRVLRPEDPPPNPYALEESNLQLYETFDIKAEPPDRDTWAGIAHTSYGATWMTLAGTFRQLGDRAAALRCAGRARAMAPWLLDPTRDRSD